MIIQKIFSDQSGEEKLYSVLISEEDLRLFSKAVYEGLSDEAAAMLREKRNKLARELLDNRRQINEYLKKGIEQADKDTNRRLHLRGKVQAELNALDTTTQEGMARAVKLDHRLGDHLSENNIKEMHKDQIQEAVAHRNTSHANYIYNAEKDAKHWRKRAEEMTKNSKSTSSSSPTTPTSTTSSTRTQSPKVQTTPAPAPKGGKQEEIAKRSQNFISRNWNKLGTKGKIGVGVAGTAAVTGLGYGAYKLANKKKENQ